MDTVPWICEVMRARSARQVARVQQLWGGYGEIVRIALEGADVPTVIVKRVSPPDGQADSISDARKRRSYTIEHVFYREYAPRSTARVARLYAQRPGELVLEDLDAEFPVRRDPARGRALDACLAWLATFHARFMNDPAVGLWPEGTYWHLATRLDELAIERTRAESLDRALASATHQTILHGDAKEANFCFARDERSCAAVDFQYTGRGCGMKDVAYLLHGYPDSHLDTYFHFLREAAPPNVAAIEREWRALFPIAQQDFARFVAGWRG
ncbi:MAG: phosphotransferase [Kofleriaceae bacterium]